MSEFFCIRINNELVSVEDARLVSSLSYELKEGGKMEVNYCDGKRKSQSFTNCSFEDFERNVLKFKESKGRITKILPPLIFEFAEHLIHMSKELEKSTTFIQNLFEKLTNKRMNTSDEPLDDYQPLKKKKEEEIVDGLPFQDKTLK